MRIGALLAGCGPRSIRARIALAIGVALVVVFVLVQLVLGAYVNARSRAEVEKTLQEQADSIAKAVQRAGTSDRTATARQAERFIGDTPAWSSRRAATVIYWNVPVTEPGGQRDRAGAATSRCSWSAATPRPACSATGAPARSRPSASWASAC